MLKMMMKIFRPLICFWCILVLMILSLCLFTYNFVNFINNDGIDQGVVYHVFTVSSGDALIFTYVREVIIALSGLFLSWFFIIYIVKKYYWHFSSAKFIIIPSFLSIFVFINPFALAMWRGYVSPVYNKDELNNFTTSFKDYYNNPGLVTIPKKKNVVMVYLESFESIFLDTKYYPADMASGLRDLRDNKANYNYVNIVATSGVSYSVAGLLSGHCGVPFFENSIAVRLQNYKSSLFTNTTCLPNIFQYNNYNVDLLTAAHYRDRAIYSFLERNFLNYSGVNEYENGIRLKQGHFGIFDASFFIEKAIPKYDKLLSKSDPFFLVVIGISTHSPDGEIDPKYCNKPYKMELMNALNCTDKSATKMIQHMIDKSVSAKEDTVIMVMSDHYMKSERQIIKKSKRIIPYHDRVNLLFAIDTSIINKDLQKRQKVIYKNGSYVDLAATLLMHYLDVDIKSFGLGKNLHSQDKTTVELFADKFDNKLYDDKLRRQYHKWLPDIYKLHTKIN